MSDDWTIIGKYLRMSEHFYERLPTVVQECASWDLEKLLDFWEDEIPSAEERMSKLGKWTPHMTPEQQVRYERLKELKAKSRPLIREFRNRMTK